MLRVYGVASEMANERHGMMKNGVKTSQATQFAAPLERSLNTTNGHAHSNVSDYMVNISQSNSVALKQAMPAYEHAAEAHTDYSRLGWFYQQSSVGTGFAYDVGHMQREGHGRQLRARILQELRSGRH